MRPKSWDGKVAIALMGAMVAYGVYTSVAMRVAHPELTETQINMSYGWWGLVYFVFLVALVIYIAWRSE